MSPERRAVLLLLGLAVGGQGLRLWLSQPGQAPGAVAVLATPVGSPLGHRDSALALARPLAPGERIDVDRASALELARLPRVGMRLAKQIVANRKARGDFGELAALDRVPGIGPGLLKGISDHVRFSGRPSGPTGSSNSAHPAMAALPAQSTPDAARDPANTPVDLNSATAAELERLPLIGPSLAGRIVAFRHKYGPFPAVDSLVRVPGIGPATLARLRERLTVH